MNDRTGYSAVAQSAIARCDQMLREVRALKRARRPSQPPNPTRASTPHEQRPAAASSGQQRPAAVVPALSLPPASEGSSEPERSRRAPTATVLPLARATTTTRTEALDPQSRRELERILSSMSDDERAIYQRLGRSVA